MAFVYLMGFKGSAKYKNKIKPDEFLPTEIKVPQLEY